MGKFQFLNGVWIFLKHPNSTDVMLYLYSSTRTTRKRNCFDNKDIYSYLQVLDENLSHWEKVENLICWLPVWPTEIKQFILIILGHW